jgi:hypothetical protein
MRKVLGLVPALLLSLLCGTAGAADFSKIKGYRIEVRDLIKDRLTVTEHVLQIGSIPTDRYQTSETTYAALGVLAGGKFLAWIGQAIPCKKNGNFTDVAIVYNPNGGNSDSIACDGGLDGTEEDFTKYEPFTITFKSETSFSGQELHISGHLSLVQKDRHETKSGLTRGYQDSTTTTEIDQSLVLVINGSSCKLKEIKYQKKEVRLTDTVVPNNAGRDTKTTTYTLTATPQSTCVIM